MQILENLAVKFGCRGNIMLTSTHDNFKVYPLTFLEKSLSLAVEA